MKSNRFFICRDTLSTIAANIPTGKIKWDDEWEVVMRDCSRQIHWLFSENRTGLRKAKKVAAFWNSFVEALEKRLEEKVGK